VNYKFDYWSTAPRGPTKYIRSSDPGLDPETGMGKRMKGLGDVIDLS
jgi:hypothetical protein